MTAVMTGGEFGAPPPSSDGSPSQTSRATGATGSPISPFSSTSLPETITAQLGDTTRRGRAHGLCHADRGEPAVVATPDAPWEMRMNLNHHTRAMVESGRGALSRQAQGRRDAPAHRGHRSEVVDVIEGARVRRGDEWVAAVPDADRARAHVVAEPTNGERARVLVEEFRDRVAAWRKEAA